MSKPFVAVHIRRLPNSERFRITRVYSRLKKKVNVYCASDSLRDDEATDIGRRLGNAIAAEIQRRIPKKRKTA